MPGDGSLGWFDVLEMFEVLGFRRRTGKFHVLAGDDSYGVYVDRGRVILATSSNRALRLGVVLLRRGAVEPSRLQAALQPHRLSVESVEPIAIGGRLMRVGAVTRDDLAEGVQEQAIEVHELNAARTAEGIYDEWVRKSLDALAELVPARYAKSEIGESFVSAIR